MIEIVPYNELITCIKTGSEMNGSVVMWQYSYLIGDSLFDAGCPNAAQEIKEFAATNPIRRIFVSHSHEDHVGACAVLSEEADIYATPAVAMDLMSPERLDDFFVMVWGQPKPVSKVLPMPDRFEIGELGFETISLPGHTGEMVGFYEQEKGWLFSADAVPLPSRKELAMPDENVPEAIASMERIQELEINVLFDSHRGPVENPREYIQKRIDYLKSLQMKSRELSSQGKSLQQIQETLGIEGPWYLEMTEGRFGIDIFLKSLINDEPSEK